MTARLIAGALLIGVVAVIAVIGPSLAPYPPDLQENLYFVEADGERQLVVSPAAPSKRHLLGTDPWGYDLLTELLYGARYTFLATVGIAVFRVLLALVLASAAPERSRRRGSSGFRVFAGIPPFIIVYFLLYGVTFNPLIQPWDLAVVQGVIIALIGLPALVPLTQGYVRRIAERGHVEAARSIGAGRVRIIRRHVLPLLAETILVLVTTEMVAVLTIVGQLGIFDMFLGGTIFQSHPPLFHSITHEWAGLIGQYRMHLSSSRWWLIAFPLAAYLTALYGFFLFSRGLEELFHRRYRKGSYL